jgi:hypothetical protein
MTAPENSKLRMEFLDFIVSCPIQPWEEEKWGSLVGSVDGSIAELRRDGIVIEAPIGDKLALKLTVADITARLKARGVKPPRGKKQVLIAALLASMSEAESAALVADIKWFQPTDRAKAELERYHVEQNGERAAMETEALGLLAGYDVEGAGRVVAVFESRQVFPREVETGWSWHGGMPPHIVEAASAWLMRSYEDLLQEQQSAVAANLALAKLLDETLDETARRLAAATKNAFSCPAMESYMRSAPEGGLACSLDLDFAEHRAYLYVHTREWEISSSVDLERLSADRDSIDGIEILPGGNEYEECPTCQRGAHQFPWSRISRLPKLPRHWGCRCCYVEYVK